MENTIEKDCSALGGLFQTIVNDMRGSALIWDDFISKASKLHSSLKATLVAIGGFLDAFQKVADMATGSRGATKEMGSALTRLCMRHRTIENKLKGLTMSIIDNFVTPLQDRSEDWKKSVAQLDKDHAKEYKRARQEIKKCATDTMRLQKKAKKGGKSDMQSKLDSAMQEVQDKYLLLEETEKSAVRTALIEERSRFCVFVSCLRPFVEHEIGLLTEITHLQEITHNLCLQASEPDKLPSSSEQVILDLKGADTSVWNFQQHSPPSSPSSIGSRKSSMCSISSINSSSSGSIKSHSPSHHGKNRNSAQQPPMGAIRLTSVSSQDSGFTSQDMLFQRPATPTSLSFRHKEGESASCSADGQDLDTTPSDNTPSASSTWTTWPNPPNTGKAEQVRPHTISSAYEKSQKRPALSAQLFEPPSDREEENSGEPAVMREEKNRNNGNAGSYVRPTSATITKMQPVLPPLAPKPKSKAVAPPKVPGIAEQAMYVNLSDLAHMAAEQQRDQGTDSDQTPTEKSPPSTMSPQFPLDLEEAIRDLDSCTAALHTDYHRHNSDSGQYDKQMKQNSLELAEAIKELEASTAALQSTYDTASTTSQTSLPCSSGYGTMNSTPAGSEDTIASGEFEINSTEYIPACNQEKYFTIPRNSEISTGYKAQLQALRPASTAGIPVSHLGTIGRRSSMNAPKPPPPVRRSSSISTAAAPPMVQRLRKTPPRDMVQQRGGVQHAPPGHGPNSNHRRSSSSGGISEPAYAELQTIQQSIQARQQQQQLQASPYATTATQNIALSAPPTPSQMPPPTVNSLQGGVHHPPPGHPPPGQAHLMQALQQRLSNAPNVPPPSVPQSHRQGSGPRNILPPQVATGDDFDLPPPPTEDELKEIEKVYSKPPPINTKPPPPSTNNQNAVRASLISELKMGSRLRRVSTDDGSEC